MTYVLEIWAKSSSFFTLLNTSYSKMPLWSFIIISLLSKTFFQSKFESLWYKWIELNLESTFALQLMQQHHDDKWPFWFNFDWDLHPNVFKYAFYARFGPRGMFFNQKKFLKNFRFLEKLHKATPFWSENSQIGCSQNGLFLPP